MYSLSQTFTCIDLHIFIELNGVDTHMISRCLFFFFVSFVRYEKWIPKQFIFDIKLINLFDTAKVRELMWRKKIEKT